MISSKHYDEVANKFIKEETMKSLVKHNLKLTLTKSINALNPREHRKATWVGVDIITPDSLSSNHEKHGMPNKLVASNFGAITPNGLSSNHEKHATFNELAVSYFNITNQNMTDFYYWGVNDEGSSEFCAVEPNAKCTYKSRGIIFISKAAIKDSPLSSKTAFEYIKKEVGVYTNWVHNNVFDATVSTMDGTISETIHNCYPAGGTINDVVSHAIEVITNAIDHKENSMALVLNIDNVSLDDDVDPIGYVFNYLNSFFGPRMTVGSTNFDKETGEAKIVFLPSELPSFQRAVDHIEHYFIDCMESYISNQEEATELEPWLLVKMLSGVVKFEDWSTVIQNAFLCALFNSIADVTFKSAAWRNTDTPA